MSKITASFVLCAVLLGCAYSTTSQGNTDQGVPTEPVKALPELPGGAQTHWMVAEPEEIVTWLAFDPSVVRGRLPAYLRFITVGELSSGNVPWARAFLAQHPNKSHWGVSFLEFVRMGTFTIDGRSPTWPTRGAIALWFARVAPSDPLTQLGPGQPYLALDFWVPDHAYVRYMQAKGYYAEYGLATLYRNKGRGRSATLAVAGLRISAECRPTGPVAGGASSAGMQVIFPPASSSVTGFVRIAFAGHREQECAPSSSWSLRGVRPLASSISLGSSTFQYGYRLQGASYPNQ
jgi:hypothetical protein